MEQEEKHAIEKYNKNKGGSLKYLKIYVWNSN